MEVHIKLVEIKQENLDFLKRLLQLYLHDISLYFPIDFDDENCLYSYDNLEEYFDNSKKIAYFIKSEEKVNGFILVEFNNSDNIIQEIFILNHNKNKGIGKKVVFELFDKNKEDWIIKSLPCSLSAEKFWDKTIKEYTNNNYMKEHIGKYNRAVFSFSNLQNMNKRISSRAVIIKDNKLLTLFRRKIKDNLVKEYYSLPGVVLKIMKR